MRQLVAEGLDVYDIDSLKERCRLLVRMLVSFRFRPCPPQSIIYLPRISHEKKASRIAGEKFELENNKEQRFHPLITLSSR